MVERSTSSSSVTTALAIGSAAIGFGMQDLFRCGLECRSCGFRKNIFLCRLFRSRWLYHGRGFCRWRMAVPERMVLERPGSSGTSGADGSSGRDGSGSVAGVSGIGGTVNKRSHRRRRIRNHNGTAIGNGLSINIEGNLIHIQCVARFVTIDTENVPFTSSTGSLF